MLHGAKRQLAWRARKQEAPTTVTNVGSIQAICPISKAHWGRRVAEHCQVVVLKQTGGPYVIQAAEADPMCELDVVRDVIHLCHGGLFPCKGGYIRLLRDPGELVAIAVLREKVDHEGGCPDHRTLSTNSDCSVL